MYGIMETRRGHLQKQKGTVRLVALTGKYLFSTVDVPHNRAVTPTSIKLNNGKSTKLNKKIKT